MRIHARVQNSPASIRCAIEYNYTLKKKVTMNVIKIIIINRKKNKINVKKKNTINSHLPGPVVSLM